MTAPTELAVRALRRNPALEPLAFLIGRWRTTGTHPGETDSALTGQTSFEWHLGGAFILMRQQVDDERFPDGLTLFGSDDGSGAIRIIYFDERGVSRHFEVSVGDGCVTWERDDPKLAQRLTITRRDAGRSLVSKGRMRENGGAWQDDLSQSFIPA